MAKSILVANWKNHPASPQAANALLAGVAKKRLLYKKIALYIAPPTTYMEAVVKKTGGFATLAAQDLPTVESGTHTGVVSLDILKSFGVKMAILGHSERRALGETDKQVAGKVKMALSSGILPLLCIGEKVRDEEGEHLEFVRHQLKASLEGLKAKKDDIHKILIAYEPVWAIGKKGKDALSPEDLAEMVLFIRKVLSDIFGREVAEKVSVLYGGSVDPSNALELTRSTGVRGLLVGRASLDSKQFAEVAEALL